MPHDTGVDVPQLLVLPFAILLLCIAALPLAAGHWWEHNRNKGIVAGVLSLPVVIWLVANDPSHLGHTGAEYISFIVLLGALFTISGGLFLDGDLKATPRVNVGFLALGAVLANVIGTTGASMLLIRPVLQTNSQREKVVHTVVFFIFLVSNVGGCLTPLGDPPLFMGYMRGVPFTWTLSLWPEWLGVVGALLLIYFVWDTLAVRSESAAALRLDLESYQPLRLMGGGNLLLLLGVVLAVALVPNPAVRDSILVALSIVSVRFTPAEVHERNGFGWGPIVEVAVLFAGIFITMVPALLYLESHGASLGVDTPREFFWATGVLSSFLDNAPTYLTFASTAAGLEAVNHPGVTAQDLSTLLATPDGPAMLRAISLGAVFMGANSYIGNGPNFMVKAIADGKGVKTPSFFGYMAYSVGILVPLFVIVSVVAF